MKRKIKTGLGAIIIALPGILCAQGLTAEVADINSLFESRGYTVVVKPTTASGNYKEFTQLDIIPDYYTGYHDEIDFVEKDIRITASQGIDRRILKCLVSQKFHFTELKSSQGKLSVSQFLSDNIKTWVTLLDRYQGDYSKMLEAYKYGTANIDYLCYRYGDSWRVHIRELEYLNKDKIDSDTVYYSFTDELLTYWEGEDYDN